ncbi:MAG: haloalkane dehalogenase [Sphingomonadales bacterium]|nr:haloalkane dehalogenase [Sphingomonadaceae bacterium]MBS3930609.1 haloalkane dehalogenase [Sphingomonadales bacterium]
MDIYRTPEERFAALPDFPFASHYLEITGGLRVHYLDEGPRDGPTVFLLHGEPTWCYLFRHMIPLLVAEGFRVVAPDLIGFGKSDKPLDRSAYSYAGQVAWMREWTEALDLKGMTLGCQDWGSLIGLRLVAESPERFRGVALSNGGLPEGGPAPRAFAVWRAFSRYSPVFPIGKIVKSGTKRPLSPEEVAAYDAPFPTRASKVAARAYPSLVPFAGNAAVPDQKRAWQVFEQWSKPFLCCFSDGDPITRGGDAQWLARVPGTKGMAHRTLKGGHFIQEDDPQGFAAAISEVVRA